MCVYLYLYVCMYLYTYRERERDFNELAHMIVEAGKSTICRIGQQLETQWKS